MAIDTATPRSRRALLTGGLAAAVAGTLGRAQPASAHDPDDVRLGANNSATYITVITNAASDGGAFEGQASGSGIGVYGVSPSGMGVYGVSYPGIGVYGFSNHGTGVEGSCGTGNGVNGSSGSSGASGVYGENNWKGYGVAGRSNSAPLGSGGVYAAATLATTLPMASASGRAARTASVSLPKRSTPMRSP